MKDDLHFLRLWDMYSPLLTATQQEIADVLGTSQTMYARYERGASELPIRHLIKLADYYDVSTDYILCRSDQTK